MILHAHERTYRDRSSRSLFRSMVDRRFHTASDTPGERRGEELRRRCCQVLRGRHSERRRSIGCSRPFGRVGAGRWWCAASPAWARRRCWTYVVERASGCQVVRAAGVQSEMELAFAGLHQLCAPMLDRLDRLPAPQRDALSTAFGLSARTGAGPFPGRAGGARPAGRGGPGAAAASAWSTTRSGSTGPPRRRWRSSRAGWARSRWRWSSRSGRPTRSRSWSACRSWWSAGCPTIDARALLGSAVQGPVDERVLGPDRRRDAGAIRSRCWSCRAE